MQKLKILLVLLISLSLVACSLSIGGDRVDAVAEEFYENKEILLSKLAILDTCDKPAEIRLDGKQNINGIDCYVYSAYGLQVQNDGQQDHEAMRLFGIFGIAVHDGTIFSSVDGEIWELAYLDYGTEEIGADMTVDEWPDGLEASILEVLMQYEDGTISPDGERFQTAPDDFVFPKTRELSFQYSEGMGHYNVSLLSEDGKYQVILSANNFEYVEADGTVTGGNFVVTDVSFWESQS